MHPRLTQVAIACSALTLAALGGCGGNGDDDVPAPTTADVTTQVIDGAIGNALVCLDKNDNRACDADEPSVRSDATGSAKLTIAIADAGKYPLLAVVGTDAVDADHGAVVTRYVMSAPADATAVVSPLTTLVHESAGSAASATAALALQAATGLSVSPLANYTLSAAPTDGSLSAAALARAIVLTYQQQATALAAAVGSNAIDGKAIVQGDIDRAIRQSLLAQAADLSAAVATAQTQAAGSAGALETALVAAAQTLAADSGLTPTALATMVAVNNAPQAAAATPAPTLQVTALTWTDSGNWFQRVLTGSLAQNTPDAGNLTRFVDRRQRSNAGNVAKWSSGSDPWRNADLAWNGSAWVACAPGSESTSSVRDAQGNGQYTYCGRETGASRRSALDVAGKSMATVYQQIRDAGYTNLSIANAATALGSATFPTGSSILYYSSTALTQSIAYYPGGKNSPPGTGNVVTQYSADVAAGGDARGQPASAYCNAPETQGSGSSATTLEALIAVKRGNPCVYGQGSFVYQGVTYTSDVPNEWWGNSTLSLGKLGTAPVNSGVAPGYYTGNTLLRVAFTGGSGSSAVTYYACKERFNNGSPRNCTSIGTGTYAIATLGDGRALTFSNAPAQAAGLTYERVFVERDGAVWFGYRSKPGTTLSARLNTAAGTALLTQLGMPVEDPSQPFTLDAGSYQGTWDLRDVLTSVADNDMTTVFINGNGSVSCQDRPSNAFHPCTLTITDPATGAFTFTEDDGTTASGSFNFLAGTASGTFTAPDQTPPNGSFTGGRR